MTALLYYPGCSLEGTASAYDVATRTFLTAVGMAFNEIEDWTCCGATAAETVSPLLAMCLAARNLALAEKQYSGSELLVPCSACYLNLKKAQEKIRTSPQIQADINQVLALEHLKCQGKVEVRHLLDLLKNQMDLQQFKGLVSRPLKELVVAPYYGCQCLRPFSVFDDPEQPVSMEPLIAAAGSRIHTWNMGAKCCGASHMNTKMAVGMQLSGAILSAARGADVIVTVCPMCQMNLEAYQKKISRRQGRDLSITILYLPQLLGLAMGLGKKALGLDLNLAIHGKMVEVIGE